MNDIQTKDRLYFAAGKLTSALKWIMISGTATYFLTELLRLLNEISLPSWAVLSAYIVINTLLYAVAKFVEGENGDI